jgi:hypothetical protein
MLANQSAPGRCVARSWGLPYSDADRLTLVRPVQESDRSPGMAAAPDFYRYRAENRSFDDLDAFYGRGVNVTGDAGPERVPALIVSSGFLGNLGCSLPPVADLSPRKSTGDRREPLKCRRRRALHRSSGPVAVEAATLTDKVLTSPTLLLMHLRDRYR